MPLVGFLNSASPDTYRFNADSFREGLAKAGFVEGKNVRIEERWARGDYASLPALAVELVKIGAVAIAATGDVASARAAQLASGTVPVVFTIGGDPVRFGLVKSINRPGGNVTGILFNQNVLGAKRVELVQKIAPNIFRIALLLNPTNPNVKIEEADAIAGAKQLGLETVTLNARNASEIDTSFEQLLNVKANAIITATDPIILDRREQIVAFASRYKLPMMGFVRQFASVGALLSYGPSISWMYRQAGDYIGQILKGAKPAEMPVLQPTKFELVINLKTAKALGLEVPPAAARPRRRGDRISAVCCDCSRLLVVQVFGRRNDAPSTRCGGRRPKSAKARNRGQCGTDGAAGAMGISPRSPGVWSLGSSVCCDRFCAKPRLMHRCGRAICVQHDRISWATASESSAPMRACALPAESQQECRALPQWWIAGDDIMMCRS